MFIMVNLIQTYCSKCTSEENFLLLRIFEYFGAIDISDMLDIHFTGNYMKYILYRFFSIDNFHFQM